MAQTLKQKWEKAEQRHFALCRTFNEIMTGPNPLTKAEIQKLIDKRPERYGFLRAWER
jgi:hypothetical protein